MEETAVQLEFNFVSLTTIWVNNIVFVLTSIILCMQFLDIYITRKLRLHKVCGIHVLLMISGWRSRITLKLHASYRWIWSYGWIWSEYTLASYCGTFFSRYCWLLRSSRVLIQRKRPLLLFVYWDTTLTNCLLFRMFNKFPKSTILPRSIKTLGIHYSQTEL